VAEFLNVLLDQCINLNTFCRFERYRIGIETSEDLNKLFVHNIRYERLYSGDMLNRAFCVLQELVDKLEATLSLTER